MSDIASTRKNREDILGCDAAAREIWLAEREFLEPGAIVANWFQSEFFEIPDDVGGRLAGAFASRGATGEIVGSQIRDVLFERLWLKGSGELFDGGCGLFGT